MFDSSIVNVETGDGPAYGASSFRPEICPESVDEYIRSTLDVDISLSPGESLDKMSVFWRSRRVLRGQ